MPKNPHADFSPVLNGYSGIGAFRFWCQTALPLTYDDSLSYYELLNKVVNYLNHTIEDLTAVESNTSALANAYDQLQKYVNDYFDDLDVEAELRNVLDAMAEDGTLDALLDPLVENQLPGVVDEKIDAVVADQINDAVAGQIDESVEEQLPALVDAGIPGEVSEWLEENVDPVGSAVVVDSSLTISGAAADAKVTGDELSDLKTQTNAVIETIEHVSSNLLNFDDPDFKTGFYININTGIPAANPTYNCTGFIPVEAGEHYTWTNGTPLGTSRIINYICGYNSEKEFISSASRSNTDGYTVPENVAFVRFSCVNTYFNKANGTNMFYKGTSIDKYYPYYDPYNEYKIKDNALDAEYITSIAENTVNTKSTVLKNDYGVTVQAKADSMTNNDTLVVASTLDNAKNVIYEFLGYFDSFNSVTFGHGYNVIYGSYVIVDNTDITVYYGNGSQQAQAAHGLTISNFLHILVKQEQTPYASIEIITNTGSYKLASALWRGCIGSIFAKVGGAVTNIIASATFKDYNQNVFLFGDSYITIGDPARYPYYLNQNGFTHIMIDGWGGRKAEQAITSFMNTIAIAKPKFAVWALGMNNSDSSSAVNANWKTATDTFIETCENEGIIPILATIPNVPSVINTYKNAYVKASGKRYVDFAKAVENPDYDSTTDPPIDIWLPGMLNPGTESAPDMVHPTALGAKALYTRFIIDVPEVMQ